MADSTTAQQQAQQLRNQLWQAANDLRGNMDANDFRNYLLGLLFYRFLSERVENEVDNQLKSDPIKDYQKAIKEYGDDFIDTIREDLGYCIEPKFLFNNFISEIKTSKFSVDHLQTAIKELDDSTTEESKGDFDNLFYDMQLESDRIGRSVGDRSKLIGQIMLRIDEIESSFDNLEIDLFGDAYEYLIGQFAANAGKKAGEFYTPQQVSKILARIVTNGKKEISSVYDPTMGSGSLLIRLSDYSKVLMYYGQDNITTTYNLARMNMILHGIEYKRFDLKLGDTLVNDQFGDQKFEAVVANPPYSLNWNPDQSAEDDERFSEYGKLAPKSKADFAFVQTMLYHLADNGTMAVVLPHGVLFRGASESVIRKYTLEQNWLDAVIGLPANLFFGTSIPTTILVFKKNRKNKDVLFIDASKEFEKGKNQNTLTDQNIDKIVKTYNERKDIEKFSHAASFDEISENDFNLNIPRYVDTYEEEEAIDVSELSKEFKENDTEIKKLEKDILKDLNELVGSDKENQKAIDLLKDLFK